VLPQIHFQIMNTVNALTGYSGFQFYLGRSPWVIPPLIPGNLPKELQDAATTVTLLMNRLSDDVPDA
jgi:hypothetical protein